MSADRPFTLSIAGFDPSAGAGVLADVKTFEQHCVYGLSIITANTLQTESTFEEIRWTDIRFILESIRTLFASYPIRTVKIGISPSLNYLGEIITTIKGANPKTKIIWDPVLKSSTAFEFTRIANHQDLLEILQQLDLVTPNYNEILKLSANSNSAEAIAQELSSHCPILLKGGHHPKKNGTDTLYTPGASVEIPPQVSEVHQKHGSGCVLSAAITANLALGKDLVTACAEAKNYIENYLNTTPTLLGYHYV